MKAGTITLSTAGNLTPVQLFFEGSNYVGVTTLVSACTADADADADTDVSAMSNEQVSVPCTQFQPCHAMPCSLVDYNYHIKTMAVKFNVNSMYPYYYCCNNCFN